MRILMWAGLCVLVAYHGQAELATLAIVLLAVAGGTTGGTRRTLTGTRTSRPGGGRASSRTRGRTCSGCPTA